MKHFPALLLAACSLACGQSTLSIPDSHPRLFWNPERVSRAQKWTKANRFTPTTNTSSSNYIYDQLLRYVVSGDTSQCKVAINWALANRIAASQLSGTASDSARWTGEQVILTYDWCYQEWTPAQRSELIERWNEYFGTLMSKSWGGLTMPASNYFWGYLRNELEWGIVTSGDNPKAQEFIDYALNARWGSSFLKYASTAGRGGVPIEGTQYGPYMVGYIANPLASMASLGRNLIAETNWYREFVYALIYLTSPAPTARPQDSVKYYQIAAWSDCCDRSSDRQFPAAASVYWDAIMRTLADQYDSTMVGKHARQWVNTINDPTQSLNYIRAAEGSGEAASFSSLPTDYYAAGSGFWSTRKAWDGTGAWIVAQFGDTLGGSGHGHRDVGSFQIWHEGRWLSKESTGYTNNIRSYTGGVAGTANPVAHNSLLFNGVGPVNAYPDGPPVTLRLESEEDHSYVAVDLSGQYRAHGSSHRDRDDNPYAKTVIREMLFVKPMNTLVVFDRMESQNDVLSGDTVHAKMAATDVTKTFLLHSEVAPVISGSTVIATSGNSVLRSTTLVPASPSIQIVNEGDLATPDRNYPYQFRTQVEQTGEEQGYFLHVLQARTSQQRDVVATLKEEDDRYTVTLTHPDTGTAVVQFMKGMRSRGGAFGFAASGSPTLEPLSTGVATVRVTEDGPSWGRPRPSTGRGGK